MFELRDFLQFPVKPTSVRFSFVFSFPPTHIISHFAHLPSCHAISSLVTRKTERNQAYTQYALGVAEPPFFPSIKDNRKCALWGGSCEACISVGDSISGTSVLIYYWLQRAIGNFCYCMPGAR